MRQELHAIHDGGVPRTVWQLDTKAWLKGDIDLELPEHFNIITSLPDISELDSRRRKSPEWYEAWFIETVRELLSVLPPRNVAIFYQTPGRDSGVGGGWLDKGHLCHLGAAQAGAKCVWKKVVITQQPGTRRGGRPGFVDMLCFSKEHRLPSPQTGQEKRQKAFKTADVILRGRMPHTKAFGTDACREAVEYCATWVDGAIGGGDDDDDDRGLTTSSATRLRPPAAAVVDPFCGRGSVLAAANAFAGAPAFGMDISAGCCQISIDFAEL